MRKPEAYPGLLSRTIYTTVAPFPRSDGFEHVLYEAFELAADPYALIDAAQADRPLFTYANQAFLSLVGYSRDVLEGASVADLLLSPTHTGTSPEVILTRLAEGAAFTERSVMQDAEGVLHVPAWHFSPIGSSGTDWLLRLDTKSQEDGPDRIRLYAQALQSVKESVLITDADLEQPGPRIVFVNPSFTEMTGYAPEDVLGKTPRLLQGPKTDRLVLDRLRSDLSDGRPFHGETVNYRKDGAEFVIQWEVAPLVDGQGKITHWVGVQRDVTQQRLLERLVLDVSEEEKRRIAQDLHDDVGQTLLGTAMRAAALERDLAESTLLDPAIEPARQEIMLIRSNIRDAIMRMRELILGLYPFSIEPGGLTSALVELAHDLSKRHDVSVEFHYTQSVFLEDTNVATNVFRIVQEVLLHAIRYGKAQTINVYLRIPNGHAVLEIVHDGAGLEATSEADNVSTSLTLIEHRATTIGAKLLIDDPGEDRPVNVSLLFGYVQAELAS